MKGYQLQESVRVSAAMTCTGTHPRVYKTRWGAWLAMIAECGWLFGESWRVVPAEEDAP